MQSFTEKHQTLLLSPSHGSLGRRGLQRGRSLLRKNWGFQLLRVVLFLSYLLLAKGIDTTENLTASREFVEGSSRPQWLHFLSGKGSQVPFQKQAWGQRPGAWAPVLMVLQLCLLRASGQYRASLGQSVSPSIDVLKGDFIYFLL